MSIDADSSSFWRHKASSLVSEESERWIWKCRQIEWNYVRLSITDKGLICSFPARQVNEKNKFNRKFMNGEALKRIQNVCGKLILITILSRSFSVHASRQTFCSIHERNDLKSVKFNWFAYTSICALIRLAKYVVSWRLNKQAARCVVDSNAPRIACRLISCWLTCCSDAMTIQRCLHHISVKNQNNNKPQIDQLSFI